MFLPARAEKVCCNIFMQYIIHVSCFYGQTRVLVIHNLNVDAILSLPILLKLIVNICRQIAWDQTHISTFISHIYLQMSSNFEFYSFIIQNVYYMYYI